MDSRVHLASLTRFWGSGVPQLPGSTLDGNLSLGNDDLDFFAVWLQNSFSVRGPASSDFRPNSPLVIFLKDEC